MISLDGITQRSELEKLVNRENIIDLVGDLEPDNIPLKQKASSSSSYSSFSPISLTQLSLHASQATLERETGGRETWVCVITMEWNGWVRNEKEAIEIKRPGEGEMMVKRTKKVIKVADPLTLPTGSWFQKWPRPISLSLNLSLPSLIYLIVSTMQYI